MRHGHVDARERQPVAHPLHRAQVQGEVARAEHLAQRLRPARLRGRRHRQARRQVQQRVFPVARRRDDHVAARHVEFPQVRQHAADVARFVPPLLLRADVAGEGQPVPAAPPADRRGPMLEKRPRRRPPVAPPLRVRRRAAVPGEGEGQRRRDSPDPRRDAHAPGQRVPELRLVTENPRH